jgi:hypothetical protein
LKGGGGLVTSKYITLCTAYVGVLEFARTDQELGLA